MGFRDVLGHEFAIRSLQKALVSDQLPGTYLFTGAPGVGKTTLALALAEAAACLAPTADPFDSCGECDSCRRARTGDQPEIMVIPPAGDQTQIWQFWDRDGRPPGALQHSLNFAPVIGRRRVYIIERADTLNEAAANSLLKVLEEPPPYVIFTLLSVHSARLLLTVLSRSHLIRLSPVPIGDLVKFLTTTTDVSPERARAFATYAEGRPGVALALARTKGVEAEINAILDLAHQIASEAPLTAMKLSERIRKQAAGVKSLLGIESTESAAPESADDAESVPRERAGRRQLGIVLDIVTAYYLDLLAARLGGRDSVLLHVDRRDQIQKVSNGREAEAWTRQLEKLMRARRHIDQNANPRLVTDALTTRLMS